MALLRSAPGAHDMDAGTAHARQEWLEGIQHAHEHAVRDFSRDAADAAGGWVEIARGNAAICRNMALDVQGTLDKDDVTGNRVAGDLHYHRACGAAASGGIHHPGPGAVIESSGMGRPALQQAGRQGGGTEYALHRPLLTADLVRLLVGFRALAVRIGLRRSVDKGRRRGHAGRQQRGAKTRQNDRSESRDDRRFEGHGIVPPEAD